MKRGPAIQQTEALIVTPTLQLAGRFEFFGTPLVYLNDDARDGIVLRDTRVGALDPGAPFKSLNRPQVTVRRSEIVLLYLIDPEIKAKASLLKREERLVTYTPLAILQGNFHMPVESQVEDFLSTTTGEFLPMTEARVFPLVTLPMDFPEHCDMLMMSRHFIQIYHPM
jgi:hypothetical protein